jgi:hypothetical protein
MEPDARPANAEISDDTTIWKYMGLAKFFATLYKRELWFAKASTFRDDQWEGFGMAKYLTAPLPSEFQEAPDGTKTQALSLPQTMALLSQNSAGYIERASEHLYVNSWCAGLESMAMWEIYGSHGSGVALKSSVGQYKRAVDFSVDDSHYCFADVEYHADLESVPDLQLDFRGSIPMGPGLRSEVLKLGRHKRECFRYEHEWRALLYQECRPEIAGVDVGFDLEQLISEVLVGPRADVFLVETAESMMEKFGLQKPCRKSDLLGSPRREAASAD